MTEVDALMAGFAGGCIASIVIIGSYYLYISKKTRQYTKANDELHVHLNLKNMLLDIKELRKAVNDIESELVEITNMLYCLIGQVN